MIIRCHVSTKMDIVMDSSEVVVFSGYASRLAATWFLHGAY
jgi:hypothetical protein